MQVIFYIRVRYFTMVYPCITRNVLFWSLNMVLFRDVTNILKLSWWHKYLYKNFVYITKKIIDKIWWLLQNMPSVFNYTLIPRLAFSSFWHFTVNKLLYESLVNWLLMGIKSYPFHPLILCSLYFCLIVNVFQFISLYFCYIIAKLGIYRNSNVLYNYLHLCTYMLHGGT